MTAVMRGAGYLAGIGSALFMAAVMAPFVSSWANGPAFREANRGN